MTHTNTITKTVWKDIDDLIEVEFTANYDNGSSRVYNIVLPKVLADLVIEHN